MKIKLILILVLFPFLLFAKGTSISDMTVNRWTKVAPGIWKTSFGKQSLNPLNYARAPKLEALEKLSQANFPKELTNSCHLLTNERAIVRLPVNAKEQLFGLGLEFEGQNRRNDVYNLKIDHYGGVKGYTHAPVPFYVSSKGYGVLINTAKRLKIYMANGNRKDGVKPKPVDRTTDPHNWEARPKSDAVEASVQGTGLEVYVFAGKNMLEVVQRYNLFTGGGAMPPKWGLGFWHRMHTTTSDKEALAEIELFKKHNFPLDVFGLEPGWQSFAYPCSYDWDKTRFPNPSAFLNQLNESEIKVNLWENPYVSPKSSLYDKITKYTGSHTVWLGEVPDYTLPAAQQALINHHKKEHLDLGVSGYKIDEVDGYDYWLWPDHATFPSGHDAVEIRQIYGLLLQNTLGKYFKESNKRTYGLIRSAYTGSSSYNFVIYSDYYGYDGYITALTNSSLAGILWTPEVRNAKTAEEWVKRFQTVAFSPLMMLNAWSSGKKPWSFPEVTDMVRENIELRIKLLPYLYSAFYDYYSRGIPPFRAMLLESGFGIKEKVLGGGFVDGVENPYAERKVIEATDQYMMGPSLLVAPQKLGKNERTVILPEGNWYDFYTGKYVGNGETITIKPDLGKMPLFVKDGGVIPMLTDVSKRNRTQDIKIRHYGTKSGSFKMYNDDGESYSFQNGAYSIVELKAQKQNSEFKTSEKIIEGSGFEYLKKTWEFMTK